MVAPPKPQTPRRTRFALVSALAFTQAPPNLIESYERIVAEMDPWDDEMTPKVVHHNSAAAQDEDPYLKAHAS
jgi:hypothetical protein